MCVCLLEGILGSSVFCLFLPPMDCDAEKAKKGKKKKKPENHKKQNKTIQYKQFI